MYYLQSRYYSTQCCRFVNADGLIDASQFLTLNQFAYCLNQPINFKDPTGYCTQSDLDGESDYDHDSPHMDALGGGGKAQNGHGTNTTTRYRLSATPQNLKDKRLKLTKISPDLLKSRATKSATTYMQNNPGKGPQYGTRVHTHVEVEITNSNLKDVRCEVSYKNGQLVPYGEQGSVRLDTVLLGATGDPIYAIDIKTGGASLTPSRIDRINSQLPFPIQIDQVP